MTAAEMDCINVIYVLGVPKVFSKILNDDLFRVKTTRFFVVTR